MAFLLFAGSWLSGFRALEVILQHLPSLRFALRAARAQGDPTALLWALLAASLAGALLSGALLLGSLLFLVLVEGTHVVVDQLGLAVEITLLPAPLARRLGAGRLGWKRIRALERRSFFFVLKGGAVPQLPGELLERDLRFLVVHEMERLVLTILERSPNLKMDD
jgi:hypothetical protein